MFPPFSGNGFCLKKAISWSGLWTMLFIIEAYVLGTFWSKWIDLCESRCKTVCQPHSSKCTLDEMIDWPHWPRSVQSVFRIQFCAVECRIQFAIYSLNLKIGYLNILPSVWLYQIFWGVQQKLSCIWSASDEQIMSQRDSWIGVIRNLKLADFDVGFSPPPGQASF